MKTIYRGVVFSLFCSELLLGANQFLKNSNIIDIGRKTTSNEIEVPKEYIAFEPTLNIVQNETIYSQRLQSPLFQCETDLLGVETCSEGREDCQAIEQLTDGYSVIHPITRTFSKICGVGHVKVNDKCYIDANNDEAIDNKSITSYIYSLSRSISSAYHPWGGFLGSYNVSCGTTYEDKFFAPTSGSYKIRIQADNTSSVDIDGTNIHSDTSDAWGEEQPILMTLSKGEHQIKTTGGNYGGPHGVAVAVYDSSDSLIWNIRSGQIFTFTECPNTSYSIDGNFCYKQAICPDNTTLQSDGTCKMTYNWYSYHCPTDLNFYENTWQAINQGSDCGNPTCTNTSTSPTNNCVRIDNVCTIDSNQKCGKTATDEINCGTGFILSSGRCERIEPYCGTSSYNQIEDKCQNITTYTKLCRNISDIYNASTNKCESNTEICTTSLYDESSNSCLNPFVGSCATPGYSYDSVTESCSNPLIPLCADQNYIYDFIKNECVATMNVCEADKVFNEITKNCEKIKCGQYGTIDSGSRCETTSLCIGTVTAQGTCIPTTLQP